MKKTIQIEIENTDYNTFDITTSGLLSIQNEVINQCGISKKIIKNSLNINVKIFDHTDVQKPENLASEYVKFLRNVGIDLDAAEKLVVEDAYCAGYCAAAKYLVNNNSIK